LLSTHDLDEAAATAAMGNVHTRPGLGHELAPHQTLCARARDEHGVARRDKGARVVAHAPLLAHGRLRRTLRAGARLASVDVFRAVPEALVHAHAPRVVFGGCDPSVGAVASTGVKLDAEQADRRTDAQRGPRRIVP